ncbi:MAG: cupin domain-containing protein [Planctomycetota bacterium]|nr:cupin domain-containing protein [Planctomycetota bacterium]
MERGNIETNLPDASTGEIIETLSAMPGRNVRIERIVSGGQFSPPGFWYDQGWDEWTLVLRGKAVIRFREPPGTEILEQGDWLRIPAHREHRVESTTADTLWLAVHAGG